MSAKKQLKRQQRSKAKAKAKRLIVAQRHERKKAAIDKISEEMISNPVALRSKAQSLVKMRIENNEQGRVLQVADVEDHIIKSLDQFVRHHALADFLEQALNAGKIEEEDRQPLTDLIASVDRHVIHFLEEAALLTQFIENNRDAGADAITLMLHHDPVDSVVAQMYFGITECIGNDFPELNNFGEKYNEIINPMHDEQFEAYRNDPTPNMTFLTYVHLARTKRVTPIYASDIPAANEEIVTEE